MRLFPDYHGLGFTETAFCVKRGDDYLISDSSTEFNFVPDKTRAYLWPSWGAARAYAEALSGRVIQRFSDGYEKQHENYEHP